MFCGKCGTRNADDAEFCTGCGARLNQVQNENSETYVVTNAVDGITYLPLFLHSGERG